jgi:hypothetical protein
LHGAGLKRERLARWIGLCASAVPLGGLAVKRDGV